MEDRCNGNATTDRNTRAIGSSACGRNTSVALSSHGRNTRSHRGPLRDGTGNCFRARKARRLVAIVACEFWAFNNGPTKREDYAFAASV